MTKAEYLEQLDYKLRVLPYSERQDALDYYDGYISDANCEASAMAQLGSPGEVAAMILANYVAKEPDMAQATALPYRKGGFKTAWVIIIAIFALPVGLPLIIGLGAGAFGLFVGLAAAVIGLAAGGVAAVVAGIASLFAVPFVMVRDFGSTLLLAGTAMASIGIGILLVRFAVYSMQGFTWIAKFVGKKITRRSVYHGRPPVQQ
jgi:uncharacterized membrane protein